MFAALIFSVLALYFILGWIVIAVLDRSIGRDRTAGQLWVGVLFWPITVIRDLFRRRGAPRS